MMGLALFLVLLCLKSYLFFEHGIEKSFYSFLALFGSDIVFCALWVYLFAKIKNKRVEVFVYGLSLAWIAINIPVLKTFGSPLTLNMIRATGNALSDSAADNLSRSSVILLVSIVILGCILPINIERAMKLLRYLPIPPVLSKQTLNISILIVIGLGIQSIMPSRFETLNLHKNPFFSLFSFLSFSTLVKVEDREWRISPVKRDAAPLSDEGKSLKSLSGSLQGKNLIVVVLESTGAQYLPQINPHEATEPMPFLAKLLKQSLLFTNAYTPYPESILGFFAAQCGLFPAINTKFYPLIQERNLYGSLNCESPAKALGRSGYQTAIFHSGRFRYLGMDRVIKNMGYDRLVDAEDLRTYPQNSFGLKNELDLARESVAWIRSLKGNNPYYLSILPVSGHHPYKSPEPHPFPTDQDIGKYRNALYHTDAMLSYLFTELEKMDQLKNTAFIFYGDHAQAFYQHQGNYGHTLEIYEENVWVPLAIYYPQKIPAKTIEPVASLVDLTPTILDLWNLPKSEFHQGESLLNESEKMALFYSDYSNKRLGLRDGKWKFIYDADTHREYLFDLSTDRGESTNLSAQFPREVSQYRNHLISWGQAQNQRIKGSP